MTEPRTDEPQTPTGRTLLYEQPDLRERILDIEAESGLDVERLRDAIYAVSVRHDWEHTTDREDRTQEIADAYWGLER